MKICRYKIGNTEKYGIILDNHVWNFISEIMGAIDENLDIGPFIEIFNEYKDKIDQKMINNKKNLNNLFELKTDLLASPIKKPSKIICLGLNYKDHAIETGTKLPDRPILFSKASTAIIGPNEDVIIPKVKINNKYQSIKFTDYEAELAIVIGKQTKKVEVNDIKTGDYIFGYVILNDVSARVEQRADKQFFRSKSFNTFAPIGPWIVTPDEIGDPMNLKVQSFVNGEIRQDSNTNKMNFNVYEIISFISEGITLNPGDIIGTGTPAGVGIGLNPPVSLKNGDKIEIKIENIGTLINHVLEKV